LRKRILLTCREHQTIFAIFSMCALCSKNWTYKSHIQKPTREVYFPLIEEEETKLDYALRGKAWKVYWLLLRSNCPMSVREVQRALRFSSPSVAHHHLEQLRELGLVQKQDVGGEYSLVGEVKIGVLRHFVKLGRLLFPRYFFYAIFSTVFYIAYLLVLMRGLTRENLFILLFGAIVTAVFWYEAFRFWRLKPI
jgi:DNA-binding transcriptional ArsR family regulator